MDTFTKVLIGLSVLYIVFYYYIQWRQFKAQQSSITWPVNISNCPDYWIENGSKKCKNVNKIGSCPTAANGALIPKGEVDFNNVIYNGPKGSFNKCRWAKKCGASWEGIDNLCA
jgi:hypothetical protein